MSVLFLFGFSSLMSFVESSTTFCDETKECARESLINDNVYCRGYKSCYQSDLTCADNCICYSLYSCSLGDIVSEDTTRCNGQYSCKLAELDVGGDAYCNGRYGCQYADIVSSNTTYCNGDYGCHYSDVENTSTVYNGGLYSGRHQDIDTSGISNFVLYQRGWIAGAGLELLCAEDSNCFVDCQSNTGCRGLDMYCHGNCTYNCDSDCTSCPTIYDYGSSDISDDIKTEWDEYRKERKLLKKQLRGELNKKIKENKNNVISNNININNDEIISDFNEIAELKLLQLRNKYNKPSISYELDGDNNDIDVRLLSKKMDLVNEKNKLVSSFNHNSKRAVAIFMMISISLVMWLSVACAVCKNSDNDNNNYKYVPIV